MMGTSVELMLSDTLMFKCESRSNEHYFLHYDEVNQHYDCITDIKKFLGVRCFCYGCMKGFTNTSTFENHICEETGVRKKEVDHRNEGKLFKDRT